MLGRAEIFVFLSLFWIPENILLNLMIEQKLIYQLMLLPKTCMRNVTQMGIAMFYLTPLLIGGEAPQLLAMMIK